MHQQRVVTILETLPCEGITSCKMTKSWDAKSLSYWKFVSNKLKKSQTCTTRLHWQNETDWGAAISKNSFYDGAASRKLKKVRTQKAYTMGRSYLADWKKSQAYTTRCYLQSETEWVTAILEILHYEGLHLAKWKRVGIRKAYLIIWSCPVSRKIVKHVPWSTTRKM